MRYGWPRVVSYAIAPLYGFIALSRPWASASQSWSLLVRFLVPAFTHDGIFKASPSTVGPCAKADLFHGFAMFSSERPVHQDMTLAVYKPLGRRLVFILNSDLEVYEFAFVQSLEQHRMF